jgi:hypothetical protein
LPRHDAVLDRKEAEQQRIDDERLEREGAT